MLPLSLSLALPVPSARNLVKMKQTARGHFSGALSSKRWDFYRHYGNSLLRPLTCLINRGDFPTGTGLTRYDKLFLSKPDLAYEYAASFMRVECTRPVPLSRAATWENVRGGAGRDDNVAVPCNRAGRGNTGEPWKYCHRTKSLRWRLVSRCQVGRRFDGTGS